MTFYDQVPSEVLIDFYYEINKNIEKGILTKSMYYELGLIYSVMYERGIILCKPVDFESVVDEQILKNYSA